MIRPPWWVFWCGLGLLAWLYELGAGYWRPRMRTPGYSDAEHRWLIVYQAGLMLLWDMIAGPIQVAWDIWMWTKERSR